MNDRIAQVAARLSDDALLSLYETNQKVLKNYQTFAKRFEEIVYTLRAEVEKRGL